MTDPYRLDLRLPGEVVTELQRVATEQRRSLNAQALFFIEQGLRDQTTQGKRHSAQQRAHRLPEDFTVTPEMVAWARENTPGVGRRETENFIDYWSSASGANARKLDWVATWRTWMRKAEQQAGGTLRSRDQRERDAMFDRAMARAEEKERRDTEGNSLAGEVRRRALPSAEG